jgi:hypothetical protein
MTDNEPYLTLAEQGKSLHFEIATGIAQVIFALHCKSGEKSIPIGEIIQASCPDKSEKARLHITEFIKDGIPQITPELTASVIAGDYSQVWGHTNYYLKQLGLAPVEPEPITI